MVESLACKLSIPLYSLDSVFWQSGWQQISREELIEKQEAIVCKDSWIIDGNYASTMDVRLPHSDSILFLDFPTAICLWRVFKRFCQYRFIYKKERTPGCPERITLSFLWFVLTFRLKKRPALLEKLESLDSKDIKFFRSPKEVDDFLRGL